MAIESLMAMHIADEEKYTTYREKMYPILQEYGGDFGYDFTINEVLKSQSNHPINRVFTIRFPDEKSKQAFFTNEAYQKIKEIYFTPAVTAYTEVATYEIV